MRSTEWRVIDEPESPKEKDLPEDWMAMFDEELANGSDAGEEAAQDAEESAIPSSAAASDMASAADPDVAMSDAQPDTLGQAIDQATDRAKDDAQFLRPSIVPRSSDSIAGQPDINPHLPTDTPHLDPVPSSGLPDHSPLTTTANTPGEYFPSTLDNVTAAQSTTSTVALAQEATVLDEYPTPPQAQPEGEPAQKDEDDAVTVYTDDVQVLPDSVPISGDADFDAQPGQSKSPASTDIENDESGESEEDSDHLMLEAAEGHASVAQPEESASDSEAESETDEAETDEVDEKKIASPSLSREQDLERPEKPSQLLDSEAEDQSDGSPAISSEIEHVDEVPGLSRPTPRRAERELLSLDEIRDASSRNYGEYKTRDAEDGEEDQSEVDSHEGEDEDEEEDEEEEESVDYDQDRPTREYDYSESEDEPGHEEARPKTIPANTEPEVIVLDSDDEDEQPAQPPNDVVKRETDEAMAESSDEGSDKSDAESDSGENIYDREQSNVESEAQERAENHDERAEYAAEEGPESVHEDEGGSQLDERPSSELHYEPEPMDEELPDDGLVSRRHDETEKHSEMVMRAAPAEPALQLSGNLGNHEHGLPYVPPIEEFQAVTYYPQPNHDSLDYLATISESAERLHALPETIRPGNGMAIDPSLYELETPQEIPMAESAAEGKSRESSDGDSNNVRSESPSSIHERNLALQLDGAAPTACFADSTYMPMPVSYEAPQIITPDPSQQVATELVPEPNEVLHEMPPTPHLTQDSLLKLETEEPPEMSAGVESQKISQHKSPTPATPVKSESISTPLGEANEPEPPMVVVDVAASEHHQDQVQASIEVDDQPRAASEDRDPMIDRNYPGLRSNLSYFAPLATLIDHYNALVDTISIATEVAPPTKARSGPKDFIMTLQLTDQSMAGTSVFAQIIRPYKPALPSLQEGDAILLRNFRVKSLDHSIILVSDSTSAWAVFSPSSEDPEIAGPPVEYGAEEKTFTTDLRQWYLETGAAMVADHQLQASIGMESDAETPTSSTAPSDAGSIDLALREARDTTSSSRGSRRRKSHRRITVHELRDGRRYTEVGSSPGGGSIHELRDGTVYANL